MTGTIDAGRGMQKKFKIIYGLGCFFFNRQNQSTGDIRWRRIPRC